MIPTLTIKAKISNLDMSTVRRAVRKELVAVAEEDRTAYITSITGNPRRGKRVRRYKPTREITISAPGDAPAGDRGLLAASVFVDDAVGPLEVALGVGAAYAAALEFDAPVSGEVETPETGPNARPSLVPILNRTRNTFDERMGRVAERALQDFDIGEG